MKPQTITLLLMAFLPGVSSMARSPDMPNGVVIDHLVAATAKFVGSPSLTVLADGTYIAAHDEFGSNSEKNLTSIFASTDRGTTWTNRAKLNGQFWSSLFTVHGALFIIGTSQEFGSIVIRRSTDGGYTWTTPVAPTCGLLVIGSYHCAPTPVIQHAGKLWRAMEDVGGPGDWPTHFRCFMLSARVDADLLRADSWTRSNVIGQNPAWLNGQFHGWLEGNAVVDRDGEVVDLLRVDAKPLADIAAIVRINQNGTLASFNPKDGFIAMPGGSVKFTVRADPSGNGYWALTNAIPDGVSIVNPGILRNTLALITSPNLRDWRIRSVIWHENDEKRFGCQYVDWHFDGDDLIAVGRVAEEDSAGGPHDFHDANFLMFYRIRGFRNLRLSETNFGLSFAPQFTAQP